VRALTFGHRTVALIALSGTALNLIGALYLAYDLFGGEHGALRTLTRAVTYGVLFFIGYAIFLPIGFSALAALGAAVSLAGEFSRASRHAPRSAAADVIASGVRSACYGIGSAFLFGWRFGLSFAVLTVVGQLAAYAMGFTPTLGLDARRRWRKHLIGVANRTVGYALAGLASAAFANERNPTVLWFGVGMGVAIGTISALMGVICPAIEEWADGLPARRLGIFGALLILCGFLLESVPHWLTVFDVPIT
jgi:hypothetical protein